MSERLKSFTFVLVMCMVCSLLLTAASTALKSAQEKNIQTDRRKNILKAAGLIEGDSANGAESIDRLYSARIVQLAVDRDGVIIEDDGETRRKNTGSSQPSQDRPLPIYLSMDQNRIIESYVIPIASKGLWGMIYGYLALQKDGSTIRGFTVYKHSETPGLGGEIENQWFQKNFVGKKIVDQSNRFVSVSITKGRAADAVSKKYLPNHVDGISGATLTGQYLTEGLRAVLSEYEPASIRFRQNILQCRMQSRTPWCNDEK